MLLWFQILNLVFHSLDKFLLVVVVLHLLLLEDLMLLCHLIQLLHATFVEVNMLFNVNFVSIHDASKSICNSACKVFPLSLILLLHQLSIKVVVLLFKEFACVLNLWEILIQWFLIVTDITFQNSAGAHQLILWFNFLFYDFINDLVTVRKQLFQVSTSWSISLTSDVPEPFKIILVVVELCPHDHVGLVIQASWLVIKSLLSDQLVFHFFSDLLVDIITIFNTFSMLDFKFFNSVFQCVS